MPDKEKATKLLGFRDDSGALVCPADVVDPSKSYTCHVGAEDGSFEPTEADLKTISELFKAVGLDATCTNSKGKGGTLFKNKKGVVICRVVEGKAAAKPASKPASKPDPEPVVEEAKAADTTKVETKPAKKAPAKKKKASKRKK